MFNAAEGKVALSRTAQVLPTGGLLTSISYIVMYGGQRKEVERRKVKQQARTTSMGGTVTYLDIRDCATENSD